MRDVAGIKSWLSLKEACAKSERSFGMTLNEADLFQLALEGKFQLSAVFVDGAFAQVFKPVAESDIRYATVPMLEGEGFLEIPIDGSVYEMPDGTIFQSTQERVRLSRRTPWPLAMIGGERARIEELLWDSMGIDREPTTNIDGTFVIADDRSMMFQLLDELPTPKGERQRYYPIGALPDATAIVTTNDALTAFASLLGAEPAVPSTAPMPKPVQRRTAQEAAILAVIGRLCLDPLRLPPVPAGKASPEKAAVRRALPEMSLTVFDKAWQRLRKTGLIAGG